MLRVLIASDETVRASLAACLTKYGYQIVCISEAAAARTIIEQARIDLCVLDWELPQVGGPELCEWINSSQVNPTPYVIALLSNSDSRQTAAAYRAGAHEFFVKPIDPDQLATRIFLWTRSHN